MHRSDHSPFRHTHNFVPDFSGAERRPRIVIGITAVMMVVEIAVGLMSHSMALLVDGWHMSTHVIAFLITAGTHSLAPRHAANRRLSFGTGKNWVIWGVPSVGGLAIQGVFIAGRVR